MVRKHWSRLFNSLAHHHFSGQSMIVYLNGRYAPLEETAISPNDRGFLMADGVYEVVRFYNGRPFKLEEHQARLQKGAQALRFTKTRYDELMEVAQVLQVKNNLETADSSIVYFQVTRGAAARSHSFPPPDTPPTVYAFAREFIRNRAEQTAGAAAITVPDERWSRCDVKSIALLPNTLAHQQARDAGAIEAFFIRNGCLQEGTHSNIMICKNDRLITPPLSNTILAGITRQTILELCRDLHISFSEAEISPDALYAADEVMIVGTTVEVTPIIRVDQHTIGSGRVGAVTAAIQKSFYELIERC